MLARSNRLWLAFRSLQHLPIVESSSVTTVTSLRRDPPNQFVYRHVGGGRWIAAWQRIVRRTGHSPREHILEKTGVVHLLTPRMAWVWSVRGTSVNERGERLRLMKRNVCRQPRHALTFEGVIDNTAHSKRQNLPRGSDLR